MDIFAVLTFSAVFVAFTKEILFPEKKEKLTVRQLKQMIEEAEVDVENLK
jgi:hypothetical protein